MEHIMSRHDQVVRENEQLRIIIQNLTSENHRLIPNLRRVTNTLEERTLPVGTSSQTSTHKNTIDEEQFRAGLEPKERRTSSPVIMNSSVESSGYVTSKDTGFDSQESSVDKELCERLIGEIAYQLDRRILTFVFQNHKRFYGYSVSNIPSKIIDASTHLLTGQVDEDFRRHLNHRYEKIKDTLRDLGYNSELHPHFSEFIVNMYGILQMRPKPGSSQATDFFNPSFLKNVIKTTTPSKLHKELIMLLDCLYTLAQEDEKPIFLW